jgi:MFS family permease
LVFVLASCLFLYFCSLLLLKDNQWKSARARPRLPLREVLGHPALRALLLAAFLHSVAFGNYEEYSALHFQFLGATEFETSIILIIGITTEVFVFLLAPRFLNDRNAILFGLAAILIAGVRWLVMPELQSVEALMALQLTHGATFGLWYAASTQILGCAVPKEVRTSGQAFVTMSVSAGMGTGAILGGTLQESLGPGAAFRIVSGISCVAAIILIRSYREFRSLRPLGFNEETGEVRRQPQDY